MLLTRSIFLQLIFPFILASGILTFILSMETVYRLIYLIVERGVSVFSVGLMLLYRLPQFLSVTLPLAIVIASVVLMVRLSTDNEIYAMNAIGISYWEIGRPFFLFGIVTTLIALSITLWIQPAGYSAFEEEKLRVLKTQTAKKIQPLVLNYDFPGKVLHVQAKDENEDLDKANNLFPSSDKTSRLLPQKFFTCSYVRRIKSLLDSFIVDKTYFFSLLGIPSA